MPPHKLDQAGLESLAKRILKGTLAADMVAVPFPLAHLLAEDFLRGVCVEWQILALTQEQTIWFTTFVRENH